MVKIFLHVLMHIEHKTYLSWVSMSSNGHRSQCVLVAGEVHVRLSTFYCYPCTVQLEEGEQDMAHSIYKSHFYPIDANVHVWMLYSTDTHVFCG